MTQPKAPDSGQSDTPRPAAFAGGLVVTGKVWTGERSTDEDFDFKDAELVLTYDGSEIDVALSTPEGDQERVLCSVRIEDILAVVARGNR